MKLTCHIIKNKYLYLASYDLFEDIFFSDVFTERIEVMDCLLSARGKSLSLSKAKEGQEKKSGRGRINRNEAGLP
jgi:hypothetical protein